MQLLAVGLNHTTAPVSLREKVAFPADQLGQAVAAACAWFGKSGEMPQAREAAILSTCNRTEIYAASALNADVNAIIDATAPASWPIARLPTVPPPPNRKDHTDRGRQLLCELVESRGRPQ